MSSLYRKEVFVGDSYPEYLASKTAPVSSPSSSSSSHSANTHAMTYGSSIHDKNGAELLKNAFREDLRLKYSVYGRSQASINGGNKDGFYATTSQLAFMAGHPNAANAPNASCASNGAVQKPRKVQDFLWTGSKKIDTHVPRTIEVSRRKREEREKRLAKEEAERSKPFVTTEREALRVAAEDSSARREGRPPAARPKAEGGQEPQVGRKVTGLFGEEMNKDYLRIGLRK